MDWHYVPESGSLDFGTNGREIIVNSTAQQLHHDAVRFSDTDALRYAFELSTKVISSVDYHAMTHCLLSMIEEFPGVKHASSYEVFNHKAKNITGLTHQDELLFRRFPLSLEEEYEDEYTDVLARMLSENNTGISLLRTEKSHYILLDIVKDVNPPRAILIEGELDEYHFTILEGLFSVYASQTALLDKKERDVLTHLLNRQSLNHVFTQILDYYRKPENEFDTNNCSWLAVLDIDHFKSINDNYGHLFGDEVLIHFANIMKEQFRFSDFIFRFGGEEFLVILNQTNAAGAQATLERFRKAVEKHQFPSGKVTVSVGYSFLDPNGSMSQLLEEADRAVYFAKESGRNQVVNYLDAKEGLQSHDSQDIELF
ncbi:Diguanylate cyclase DosC [Thalassocella blandensis]|nr:Diguanylate cyclase DosC [Thalassocella blandensis]